MGFAVVLFTANSWRRTFCLGTDRVSVVEDPSTGQTVLISNKQSGFSLIEMVIVILVIGIVAAMAAPRVFDTATSAEQNTTRQQLAVLRNAIEMYRARAGIYPAQNELKNAVVSMLSSPFPAPSIGVNRGNNGVFYDTDADESKMVSPRPEQRSGWAYKPINGSLKLNVGEDEIGCQW